MTVNATAPRSRWALWLIFGVYVPLALAYNLAAPVGPSPDELGHAYYVRYLVVNHHFPVLAKPCCYEEWSYEAHQPPLYYVLAAPIWAAVDAKAGQGTIHSVPWKPGAPAWMLDGANGRRGHAVRLLSTLIGAAGLILLWRLVGLVYPSDEWLQVGATGFAAFLPMRLSLAAAVSNDIAIEMFFTASLVAMAILIRRGYTHRRAVALGAVLGAAILTKSTAVLLLPIALATLVLINWPPATVDQSARFDWRQFVVGGVCVFGTALLIAAPWLLRNWLKYGDLLGSRAFAEFFLATQATPAGVLSQNHWTVGQFLTRYAIPQTYDTFWGVFGPITVWMNPRVYQALLVPSLFVPAGIAIHFLRASGGPDRRQRALLILLACSLALVAFGYVRYNLLIVQLQSRFLMAAMAPIALFSVLGWLALVPRGARALAAIVIIAGMAALAVYAVAGVIAPYYR